MNPNCQEGNRETRDVWSECFLLCDYARAEHGKLYILGGGWDEIVPDRLPLDYKAYLAIKLVVRWSLIESRALIRIDLLDTDGNVLGDPVEETQIEGSPFDVPDESAGLTPIATLFMGTEVNMTLARPGTFTLRLRVNDLEVSTLGFKVAVPHDMEQDAGPQEQLAGEH